MTLDELPPEIRSQVLALNNQFMTLVEQGLCSAALGGAPNIITDEEMPVNAAVIICGAGLGFALESLLAQCRDLQALSEASRAIAKARSACP